MSKEDFYRTLIFAGSKEDVCRIFAIIPDWKYSKKYENGIEHHCIENEDKNVKIILKYEIGFQSVNVLPIKPSDNFYDIYEEGYDASENQKSNLQEDILYSLCLQINTIVRKYNEDSIDDSIEVLCGIVPSIVDCKQ